MAKQEVGTFTCGHGASIKPGSFGRGQAREKKRLQKTKAFLVRDIPAEYLEAAKEAAAENDLFLKDLIIGILRDIYTQRKEGKKGVRLTETTSKKLADNEKVLLLKYLQERDFTQKRSIITFLLSFILSILEDKGEELKKKRR